MPKRSQKVQDQSSPDGTAEPSEAVVDPVTEVSAEAGKAVGAGIPRWRKIEILRERAELREALGEDDPDLDALELEIFGSEEEYQWLYQHTAAEEEEEDIEYEDDDFEEEEYDDFEET